MLNDENAEMDRNSDMSSYEIDSAFIKVVAIHKTSCMSNLLNSDEMASRLKIFN